MTRAAKWAPPQVFPVGVTVPGPAMAWAQRMADAAYEGEGPSDESALATESDQVCASLGAVVKHIDELEGESVGKLVYGLVLRSDGHRVHTADCPEGIPLNAGDLYCIDPLVQHWTTCPNADSELIFSVAIQPPDSRTPKKLAEDFRMNVIVASIEHLRASQQQRKDEAFAYRGVGAG